MEGVLQKRGQLRGWRARYFVIQPAAEHQPAQLIYYRGQTPGTGPPAGVLSLAGATVAPAPGGRPGFTVAEGGPGGAAYHLLAGSSQEQAAWVGTIQRAIDAPPADGTPAQQRRVQRLSRQSSREAPPSIQQLQGGGSAANLRRMGSTGPDSAASTPLRVQRTRSLPWEAGLPSPSDAAAAAVLGWREAARNAASEADATAARAMYAISLARAQPDWAVWSPWQAAGAYATPEVALAGVRCWPSAASLADCADALSFASLAYARLFCALGGARLLVEALLVHLEAEEEQRRVGSPLAPAAADAAAASLQCLHALASSAVGMDALLACPEFLPAVALALDPEDADRSEQALQLLAQALLYSQLGYVACVATLLGDQAAAVPVAAPAAVAAEGPGGSVDIELSDHCVRLVCIALSSPEAGAAAAAPLRARLAEALLQRGLLKVTADLREFQSAYLDSELDRMRELVAGVLSPPQQQEEWRQEGKLCVAVLRLCNHLVFLCPSVRMKSVHWDKLPDARIEGTFWASAGPPPYASLETAQLEAQFCALQRRQAGSPGGAAGQQGEGVAGPAPRRAALVCLDLKRATAIGIRSSRLRCHWRALPAAVAAADLAVLASAEDVRAVFECLPSEEEQRMLASYLAGGGAADGLADAEQLCWELGQVPRARECLQALLFKHEAPAQLAEARAVAATHVAAAAQLRASPAFAAVLRNCLAVGNYFNRGSRLGAAAGFRLRSLLRLQDTKSLDGRTSLLSWLAAHVSSLTVSPAGPLPLLSAELPAVVDPCLRVSLAEGAEALAAVGAALAQVRRELAASPAAGPLVRAALAPARAPCGAGGGAEGVRLRLEVDAYRDAVETAVGEVSSGLAAAEGELAAARAGFAALAAWYGDNASALSSEQEWWRDVAAFVEAFSAAQTAVVRDQVAEQEHARRTARGPASATHGGKPRHGGGGGRSRHPPVSAKASARERSAAPLSPPRPGQAAAAPLSPAATPRPAFPVAAPPAAPSDAEVTVITSVSPAPLPQSAKLSPPPRKQLFASPPREECHSGA
eukprot:scaffold16.g103.t1